MSRTLTVIAAFVQRGGQRPLSAEIDLTRGARKIRRLILIACAAALVPTAMLVRAITRSGRL